MAHIAGMASLERIAGQIVRVSVAAPGMGKQAHIPYIVAEGDPAKAEKLIGALMTPNERITAVFPLPRSVIDAFGLKPGQFTHFRFMP